MLDEPDGSMVSWPRDLPPEAPWSFAALPDGREAAVAGHPVDDARVSVYADGAPVGLCPVIVRAPTDADREALARGGQHSDEPGVVRLTLPREG